MPTLLSIAALGRSQNLRDRVYGAVLIAATAIQAEDADTPNHAKRLYWASETVKNPDGCRDSIMTSVVANSTIQASGESSTDDEIQTVIDLLIDTHAEYICKLNNYQATA